MQDKVPLPGRVWNRIPNTVRDSLITLALNRPELSPRVTGYLQAILSWKARFTGFSRPTI